MMKHLFLALCLLFCTAVFSQQAEGKTSREVRKYLEEVRGLIKKHALYAESVNWQRLDIQVRELSKGMHKIEECEFIVDTIMMALRGGGDNHSGFLCKESAQKLTNNSYRSKPVESGYLPDNIGYIRIPMFASMDLSASEKFAADIQDHVRHLDESNQVLGWIVDLRGNNGGNMHPMIKGLSSLLGEGVYGYVIYPKQVVALSMDHGQTGYIKLPSPYRAKRINKMAVLIDSSTASSGEFTAIAFKSLPNVRFFGQPSGGYTTSNQTFKLADGSYLYLATAYMADRKKNTYLPNILPDVITPPKQNNDSDPAIEAARKWLSEK